MEQLDSYYNIYENIINYFDSSTRNYSIIKNLNYITNYNNNLMKNIDTIINDKNINKFLNSIMLSKLNQNDKEYEKKEIETKGKENETKGKENETKGKENETKDS